MEDSNNWQAGSLAKTLLPYLRKQWPGGDALSIQDLVKITSGWENEVYSLQLVNGVDNSRVDLILRIYPGRDAEVKSRWEFGIMDLLGRTGFPVPAVYLLEQSVCSFSKPLMIMERIFGPSLRDLFSEADTNDAAELFGLFCHLFVALHRWDWRRYHGELTRVLPSEYSMTFKIELERWQQFCGPGFDSAFDWLLEGYSKVSHQEPCLTHGDFHPSNIIMGGGMKPYVIDWGGARLQDFRLDLAWTMLLLSTYGHWQMGDLLLDEYQALVGFSIPNMDYFLAVAALRRLLSVYASVTAGAEQLGMRPGAVAMMVEDLPHLRRVYEVYRVHTGLELPLIDRFLEDLATSKDDKGVSGSKTDVVS